MSRAALAAGGLAVGAMLAIACSSGSDDSGGDVSSQEIADVLMAFSVAFANNDIDTLNTFWSETCSDEDIFLANTSSEFISLLSDLTGEYNLQVDAESLEFEPDGDRVTVPIDQPEAFSATAGDTPLDGPFIFELPVTFVREDGEWKVESCILFTNEDEDDDGVPFTPTQPASDADPERYVPRAVIRPARQ